MTNKEIRALGKAFINLLTKLLDDNMPEEEVYNYEGIKLNPTVPRREETWMVCEDNSLRRSLDKFITDVAKIHERTPLAMKYRITRILKERNYKW